MYLHQNIILLLLTYISQHRMVEYIHNKNKLKLD